MDTVEQEQNRPNNKEDPNEMELPELGGFRDNASDTNIISPSIGSTQGRNGYVTLSTDDEASFESTSNQRTWSRFNSTLPNNDGQNVEPQIDDEYGPKLPPDMIVNESQHNKSSIAKASHSTLKRTVGFGDKPGTSSDKRQTDVRPYHHYSNKKKRLDLLEAESAVKADIIKVDFFKDVFQLYYSNDSSMLFYYGLIEQELWRRPVYKFFTWRSNALMDFNSLIPACVNRIDIVSSRKPTKYITLAGHYDQVAMSELASIFSRMDEQLRCISLANLHVTEKEFECYCLRNFIRCLLKSVKHLSLDLRTTHYRGLQAVLRWICESDHVLDHLSICIDTETNYEDFLQSLERLHKIVPDGSTVILVENPHKWNKKRFRGWRRSSTTYRHHIPHSKTEFTFYEARTLEKYNIQFLLRGGG